MKKQIAFILLTVLFHSSLSAQTSTPKEAFIEKWENSKNYLLEVAEAMPENAYNFKPTERQMSFKEQLIHIKGNMDWLSNFYFSNIEYKRVETPLPSSKAETIILLEIAFNSVAEIIKNTPDDNLKDTVDFLSEPKSKLQILNLLQDHVTHHRGQLVVYLNLNSIKPPKYIGW